MDKAGKALRYFNQPVSCRSQKDWLSTHAVTSASLGFTLHCLEESLALSPCGTSQCGKTDGMGGGAPLCPHSHQHLGESFDLGLPGRDNHPGYKSTPSLALVGMLSYTRPTGRLRERPLGKKGPSLGVSTPPESVKRGKSTTLGHPAFPLRVFTITVVPVASKDGSITGLEP